MRVVVVIPALNEELSIGSVLNDVPRDLVEAIVVVDNGSADRTSEIARAEGAHVVQEPERGYGAACLAGIRAAETFDAEVLAFVDGDYSDHVDQLGVLLEPINQGLDMVIGSRMRGQLARGAMPPQARFGNRLASILMRWGWGAEFTDLGPFRAIRMDALRRLRMADRNFGWTVEMQVKAVEAGLRYTEVPVDYRVRIGHSKISGTLSGTIKASFKILWVLASYWTTRGRRKYATD